MKSYTSKMNFGFLTCPYNIGTKSAHRQKFQFAYLISRYLYIYYLPSGLFVVVSWVSFLIPPEVVPGRMALLVTLFLVLTNIFNSITNISPNTEGMTAITSWMIACMFFVFSALMAYATILYFLMVSNRFVYVLMPKILCPYVVLVFFLSSRYI